LWLKSPIFGIGFRQHEQFLAGAPSHNAYLAMLADTGILGLIVYLVLLIGSLMASWGIQDRRTRRFVLALVVSYVVIGFFERRAINSGNPYGVFFLMCCAVALVDQSLRKASMVLQWSPGMASDGRRPTRQSA
jgi:O-antigen ligase